ncbi:MAG: Wzz/FepE/Etk N-terminal domain-containing protein [Pseudomonadota bacterium]
MNRRLPIFVIVFLLVCVVGLVYTYSIPPTYEATATLQVDAGTNPDEAHKAVAFVANEAQAFTSNDMLESVLTRIKKRHPEFLRLESIARLREVLAASTSPGTNVIELRARGSEPLQLAQLLEIWAAAYLESRGERRNVYRGASVEDARKAVEATEARAAQRRRELDQFRRRHGIVSPEREENEVAAQVKSLTTAMNDARTKAIDAESRLATVKESLAEGKPVYRPQDRTAIAQIEQRLLDARQKQKDLELKFTPSYIALDPSLKMLDANIKQLEKQLEDTRRESQQAMSNEATQEVATTRKNVARMESQFEERRRDALNFTSRFAEHKAQTTELAQLEAQLTQAKQRLASVERREVTREPQYELLGHPVIPAKPVHPDYILYSAYSVGAAVFAALLAVLLVEFLSPRPRREAPAYPQPIIQIAYPSLPGAQGYEPARLAGSYPALPAVESHTPALSVVHRELGIAEVQALWNAATRDGRLAVAALFSGLTLPELAALQWRDIDFDAACVQLAHRVHRLIAPLYQELQARKIEADSAQHVASTRTGAALSIADLDGLIAAAAHDARIEQSHTIDARSLRHTYVSFLVRTGVRLSDLEHIVGPVPPASFLYYRNLAPSAASSSASAQERIFPVFRRA